MVYNVRNMNVTNRDRVPTGELNVPSTVEEVTVSSQDEGAITVLDLSDPKDMAMFVEAGYEIKELSTSSQLSFGSSETMSLDMEDMSDLDVNCFGKDDVPVGVKRELKWRIQAKRLQSGKDILPADDTPKNVGRDEKLSPEEEERKKLRREKNKLAAQKCRGKRQKQVDLLEKESEILVSQNETLREQIKKLQIEKEMLDNMVRTHDRCPRSCNTCLSTSSEEETTTLYGRAISDPGELMVETEYVIDSSEPVSPFSMALIDGVADAPLLSN